jgi:hypothetical protein
VTRALPLPARQVTALAKGAAKAGCIAEVKIGDMVIRLVPADKAQPESSIADDADPATFDAPKHRRCHLWNSNTNRRRPKGRTQSNYNG